MKKNALFGLVTTTTIVAELLVLPFVRVSAGSSVDSDAADSSTICSTKFSSTLPNTDEYNLVNQKVTISMDQVMDNVSMPESQRLALVSAIVSLAHSTLQDRSRYYKLHTKLTAKQVKRDLGSMNKLKAIGESLTSALPDKYTTLAYAAAVALYGSYYHQLKTAAKHGWGLNVTLTVDSYNQTSTGMSWTVSYIK